MDKDQIANILKVLLLGTGVAAYFIREPGKRRLAIYALLISCTALVAFTFLPGLISSDKDTKSQAIMDSSMAEFVMRLSSSIDTMLREAGGSSVGSLLGSDDNKMKQMLDEMHQSALSSAKTAVEHDPSVSMRFRKIVIAAESRLPFTADLHKLKEMPEASAAPAAHLIEQLYEKHSLAKSDMPAALTQVESLTARGWLREVAKIEVYRAAGDKSATKLLENYQESLMGYAYRLLLLAITVGWLGFVGTIILASQCFFWPRKLTPDQQRSMIAAPQSYGFLKIYGVFIGWLALECACSPLLGDVVKIVKKPGASPDPLIIGLVIFVIYTLNNVPALVIAWLVALKATGLRFVDAVKLRFKVTTTDNEGKVKTAGPIRLVLSGVAAWLCAMPLILISAFIAKNFTHSGGSANPILPVIAEVVRSGAWFTIFLYIFVLGVMPALCEETLFRGFLYTSLRVKHGVFVSVLISAAVFAAVHLDPGAFLQLFILGAVFALVMERTKSLLPSMIAHCLWNSGTLVLMMVAFGG